MFRLQWQAFALGTLHTRRYDTESRLIEVNIHFACMSRIDYVFAEDRAVRGAISGNTQRDMGFIDFGPEDCSLTNAETHGLIRYFDRPVTGDPNDTWEALAGNQTGRVDIQEYMRWLCGNGYFKEGAAQCPAAEATP